ncbi:hypothetical protein JHK82_016232 [Glycine max]|nr:hypothetical protein JHK86_016270 [Glycine max]KAG5149351.1 hypothetical protein JHK82_016232 [Glycine max]
MHKFAFLLWFISMHVIIHGNIAANESSDDKGIIGAILDKSSRIGQEHAVAMKLALEDFYQKSIQSFSLHIRNSQGDPLLAAIAAKDLIDNQKVQAIIGPQTWAETSLVAEISSQKRIPFLSLAEATPEWAMKKWHFLLQSSPSQIMQMKAIAEIVKSWKLYNITMIYEDGDSSSTKILSQLSEALTEFGTELSNAIAIPPLVSSSLSQQLEKLREGQCRVIIVHLSFPLALNLFETAKRMNIMGEGNVWITTGSFTSLVHSLNASTISNMQGVIGVKSYIPKLFPQYADFYRRFRKKFSSENFEEFNYEPGIFAAEAYDAARIVVDAMRETNQIGGQLLLDKIMLSNFTGLSGKIQFTKHGRAPAHTFKIINLIGRSYREIGFWSDGLGFSKYLDEKASYSSSVKELGKVVNPTCAIRLRIGVPSMSNVKQYAEVIQDLSQNVPSFNFKGFSICLFDEIVKKLPYRLEYDYFAFNGTYDELVKQVYLKIYTASLASMLTVERSEPTVDSIQQLKNNNAIVGCDRGSYLQRYLQDALGINANKIKPFNSMESLAYALRNKEIAAVFLDVPQAKIFLAKHCKGFVQAMPTYKIGGYGFVFPRGSPLLHSVNQALLNISESGTLRDLENRMLASEKCIDIIDPDAKYTSLSPTSFMVPFFLTGGTSTIALLIYIFSANYLCHGQRTMWGLMMAVIKR